MIANVANVLVVVGIGCLSVSGWLLHPAVGLAVVGGSSLLIGLALARQET